MENKFKKICLVSILSVLSNSLYASNNMQELLASYKEYEIISQTNASFLASQAGITINELNLLNNKTLGQNEILKPGETIKLPIETKIPFLIKEIDSSTQSSLPELNRVQLSEESIVKETLDYTGLGKNITGTTEENIANNIQSIANEDWKNFSTKKLLDDTKNRLESDLKGGVKSKINTTAESFLGKFGKAEVNLSIDDKGDLQGSSFRVLSPLVDNKESLFFSQVGVHGQGTGENHRTIGNFGLGYRYDQEDYLVGANAFIDHDFDGSNTRLGLGTEYWQDYYKLGINYYTPLSGWKESEVMKSYEALIYDEKPAEGFDIRAKGALPSYPQLGGSVVFEQYFGKEVDLFGVEDRTKDPFALTLGLDYTPVPLITNQIAYKVSENDMNDFRFNMNLNLQLGTPIEDQLNPDNVALSKTLKGSRYDIVDRNYDIVFDYRKEDFSLKISAPSNASINDVIPLSVAVQSRAKIVSYEWIVTTDPYGNGIIQQAQAQLDNQNTPNATFILKNGINHYVRVKVKTERGYEAISEPHLIKFDSNGYNISASVINGNPLVIANEIFENIYFDFKNQQSISDDQIAVVDFNITKVMSAAEAQVFNESPVEVYWRESADSGQTNPWKPLLDAEGEIRLELKPKGEPLMQKSSDADSIDYSASYEINLIASESFIDVNKSSKTIDLRIADQKSAFETIVGKGITFRKPSDESILIDPKNVIVEIYEPANGRSLDKTITVSGFKEGNEIQDNVLNGIEANKEYAARVCTKPTAITAEKLDSLPECASSEAPQKEGWVDVTELYRSSIVWLYWSPWTGSEISARDEHRLVLTNYDNSVKQDRTYRALEACSGSSTFKTQISNYKFNELGWGDILKNENNSTSTGRGNETSNKSEQGMRLAVQIDYMADIYHLKQLSSNPCEPLEVSEITYAGFDEKASMKAVKWISAVNNEGGK